MIKLKDILNEDSGYLELIVMHPKFSRIEQNLLDVWMDWKHGSATKKSDIPKAKKDLLKYIEKEILK